MGFGEDFALLVGGEAGAAQVVRVVIENFAGEGPIGNKGCGPVRFDPVSLAGLQGLEGRYLCGSSAFPAAAKVLPGAGGGIVAPDRLDRAVGRGEILVGRDGGAQGKAARVPVFAESKMATIRRSPMRRAMNVNEPVSASGRFQSGASLPAFLNMDRFNVSTVSYDAQGRLPTRTNREARSRNLGSVQSPVRRHGGASVRTLSCSSLSRVGKRECQPFSLKLHYL